MSKSREVQPAHAGGTVTVNEAQRVFREVRDSPVTPSVGVTDLFVQNLEFIDRIADRLVRRSSLAREDGEEFASWVKTRLIENDYATLRKFRGESQFTTYLAVVISMLFRDYRVQRWARWRPSSTARRQGELAVHLEDLVMRQGFTIDQAGEILRTRGLTDLSNNQLVRLFDQGSYRSRHRPTIESDESLENTAVTLSSEDSLLNTEAADEAQNLLALLLRAMEDLDEEDRTILRMRFWDGRSVAETARALGIPQKPLYRRLDRLLSRLRDALVRDGVSADDVRALLEEVER